MDNTELESALLSYHSAPLACGYTPAQLLMAHRLRLKVPTTASSLKSQVATDFTPRIDLDKVKRMMQFNHSRAARTLPLLVPGEEVWIKDRKQEGLVQSQVTPRSYVIHTPNGEYRRNRSQVNKLPSSSNSKEDMVAMPEPVEGIPTPMCLPKKNETVTSDIKTASSTTSQPTSNRVTRSGRAVVTPARYKVAG